jgi:predicted ATPase
MITNIQIRNFKSIRVANVNLKSLNILIGANGAGKSNFINCFKMLNKIYNQELRTYVAEQGGANNILYFGRKKSDAFGFKVVFGNSNYYDFLLSVNVQNAFFFGWEHHGFNKNFNNPNEKIDWSIVDLGTGHIESYIKEHGVGRYKYLNENLDSFRVYHFHDTSASARVKVPSQVADNRFLREDGANLAAFLYHLQKKYPPNFKLIEATIKSIAPFFKQFNLMPSADNEKYIALEWQDVNGSDSLFDASNLSDGTLRMMCLTTLLLQPELPQTIIIDEPELGLHPFAINKLAGLLRIASKKTQIIISTQSVNLIDNFEPENIIVVDRDKKEEQSVFRNLKPHELDQWLQDYSLGEIWDKNLIGGRPA